MDILTIPRIMTAVAEWSSCMIFIFCLKKRGSMLKTILISGGFLLVQSLFLQLTGSYESPVFWIGCMLAAVVLMLFLLFTTADIRPLDTVYYCAIAFMGAEFMASLAWGTLCYVDRFGWNQPWFRAALAGAIYTLCLLVLYQLERRILPREYIGQTTVSMAVSAVLLAALFFVLSNISFVSTQAPFATVHVADIFNYRTFLDFGGCAVMLFYQAHEYELTQRLELQALERTLESQYSQYRDYQQTIELVHIMKHDLKHQIEGLRAEHDAVRREAWLEEMEKNLDELNLVQDTGNPVLNAVIEAKMVGARRNGIRLTYVIDGKNLDFMHVSDICSIFGNALDNAIESVSMLPEAEKRMIHMKVYEHRQFLYAEIANYTELEKKNWEGQLPKTTKADKQKHGYGLKSIVRTAEKYGGTVNVDIKDHWFILRLLFPGQGAAIEKQH